MKSFTKITVLIPTRHRTHRLRTLIDSYRKTTENDEHCSELLFRVDDDDAPTRDLLDAEKLAYRAGSRLNGYSSLPLFFNELAAVATGDVLMLGNDDMVFRTPGWATKILASANQYPDGLFDLGVRTHNEGHYPFATVAKAVRDRLGHVADPQIFWVDIYLRDVMAAFGRCAMVDVTIDHDWAGFAPDLTFSEGHRNPVAMQPDYWTRIHPDAVSRAVTSLKEMRQ